MTAAGAAKRHRMLRVIHKRNAPMTVRALCKAMGYRSTSSCWAQAEQLEAQGLLRHVTGYELTEEGRKAVEG
jgi:Mn-dependent DtxR family transcriptional regulator